MLSARASGFCPTVEKVKGLPLTRQMDCLVLQEEFLNRVKLERRKRTDMMSRVGEWSFLAIL